MYMYMKKINGEKIRNGLIRYVMKVQSISF